MADARSELQRKRNGLAEHTALIKQDPIEPLMLVQSIVSTLIYAGLLAAVTIRLYKREALLG
mgnify:CR=1 FL=1